MSTFFISVEKRTHLINLQKPWRRIRKKVGLDDVRIHDLRHTFASIAASNGLSLSIIGALLGHKQTQTTARYAHLIGQPLIEASEMIGDRLWRGGKPFHCYFLYFKFPLFTVNFPPNK